MSYTKTTNFAIKDTYLTGNPAKVIKGAEIDAEFNAIEANFNGIGPLGTAAATAVTTSPTDTTAGRVLKVGDFGLGGAAPLLVTDANAVPTGGSMCVLNTPFTNGPTATYYTLYSMLNESAVGSQLAVPYATGAASYTRTRTGGVWSAWVEVATSANSIGQGQTWQDVTGSRAANITYTNSTGRPIEVWVSFTVVNSGIIYYFINGVQMARNLPNDISDSIPVSFVVPNGATYRCNTISTLSQWSELR